MTEHFLHGAEVGTSFKQVCSKGMPECVGMEFFLDARLSGILDNHVTNRSTGELSPPIIQKKNIV